MEIKTKYNIDDTGWAMVEGKGERIRVNSINTSTGSNCTNVQYCFIRRHLDGHPTEKCREVDMFDTKEELIAATFGVNVVNKCKGIAIGDGNFSGCEGGDDCPTCEGGKKGVDYAY